jgi:hypothetical protein
MGNIKHSIWGFFGSLALIVLIIFLTIWILALVLKPELLGNIKNVVGPIFELISLGAIGAFISKRFKKYLKETQNLSAALVKTIGGEWVIQLSIWMLLVATAAYFIYTMPLYKVVISIAQSTGIGSTEMQPPNLSLQLGEKNYMLRRTSTDSNSFNYESDRVLRWGDSSNIIKSTRLAGSTAIDTIPVPWAFSGILGNLFNGIEVAFEKDILELRINVLPQSADASTRIATPSDTSSWSRLDIYTIERGMPFTISVAAENYAPVDSHFVEGLVENTTIDMRLTSKPGTATFQTVNEAGRKIDSLKVYIDGEYKHGLSWQKLSLAPGEHNVYMEKPYSENEKLAVDTFLVRIFPEKDTVITSVVSIVAR